MDQESTENDFVVTPSKVSGKIDYLKLMEQFGTQPIDDDLIKKFTDITGKEPHPWIRRGIFFSHRGLNDFLEAYERGDPVFIYTGRGPSGEMHIGHMIPFLFTKYLQDVFDCPVVIQMSDDEKYYYKKMNFHEVYKLGFENAKDIISFGFNPDKTFIFSNRDYRLNTPEYEEFASTVSSFVNCKTISKIFGFDENASMGMHMWPIYQSIASFSKSYPHIFNGKKAYCLVAYAIDQDPYFRLARDIAIKMRLPKPCSVMSVFLNNLTESSSGKMSSSTGKDTTLFLTDSPDVIKKKINKHAFSGGGGDGSFADHKKYGGNPDVDIPCQYLRYFEMDDDKLTVIHSKFKSGEIGCGDTKRILIETLIPYITNHQEIRKKITEFDILHFYQKRNIFIPKYKINKLDELKLPHELHDYLLSIGVSYEILDDFSVDDIKHKSLLLRGSGKFYLLTTHKDTHVDANLKEITQQIGIKGLKFADPNNVKHLMGMTSDNLSVLGLFYNMKNKENRINVLFDKNIRSDMYIECPHRESNSNRLVIISYCDMVKFLESVGYYDEITYVTI